MIREGKEEGLSFASKTSSEKCGLCCLTVLHLDFIFK